MACIGITCICMADVVTATIVLAFIVIACIVTAYLGMICIVMADIGMACVVMAYTLTAYRMMAYTVMDPGRYGLYSYGLCRYGEYAGITHPLWARKEKFCKHSMCSLYSAHTKRAARPTTLCVS